MFINFYVDDIHDKIKKSTVFSTAIAPIRSDFGCCNVMITDRKLHPLIRFYFTNFFEIVK